MTQGANPFAGMRGAATSQQGSFLSPGRYKLKINKYVYRPTQNSGDVFLIECTVLESTNPATPVGAERTWMQGTKNKQVYLSAVKSFAAAMVGLDLKNEIHARAFAEKVEPTIEETMLTAITTATFNGREVIVDVTNKEKKTKPGEFFDLHVFSPGQAPMQGLVAA